MDYCKIKNLFFIMKLRKKDKKIDFRGFLFAILGTVTFSLPFFFFLGKITSNKNGKQTHPDDMFLFCVCHSMCHSFFVIFWTAVTHFTWTL